MVSTFNLLILIAISSKFRALSASTMLGDAFLHLIPQALALHDHGSGGGSDADDDHDHDHDHDSSTIEVENYVLKQVVVICALYAFYLLVFCSSSSSRYYG